MTKIVLADDEAIVRKGIILSIDWEAYGVEICGEAPNGEEALKICMECRPDLVITDIRMPKMDGLELAERLQDSLPGAKVIILSGYEDFDYAKRAIVLGVSEYLLKPVNEEELVAVVCKLQRQIAEETAEAQAQKNSEYLLKQNRMNIRSKFVRQILENAWDSQEEILQEAVKRKIDLRGSRYGVFRMKMDQEYLWEARGEEFNRDLYRFAVCNIGEEILEEKVGKGLLAFYEGMEFTGLLCMEYLERFSLTDILRELQEKIREYLKMEVSIGVGTIYSDLREMGQSFREAGEVLKGRFYTGTSSVLFYSELEAYQRRENGYPIKEERQAVSCQKNMDEAGTLQILAQIFEEFQKSRPVEAKVKDDCCRFVNVLIKGAAEEGVEISRCLGKSFNAYADIQKLENLQEIQEWMIEMVKRLHRGMKQGKGSRYSILVAKAMKYMDGNYQKEITLSELADVAGVSPNYLSRLFKEEAGINFVDWLNQLRIEKAIQMMEDSTKKIYEIAECVGFSDYKYFSSIFKKVTGCTPKQYQKLRRDM